MEWTIALDVDITFIGISLIPGSFPGSDALRLSQVVRIVPASWAGGIRPPWEVDEQSYDFIISGEFTPDNGPPTYESSIATALAAGLAATLLVLSRLVQPKRKRLKDSDRITYTPSGIVMVPKRMARETKFVFLAALDTNKEEMKLNERTLFHIYEGSFAMYV
jgi:hypothetical protein